MQKIYHKRNELLEFEFYQDKDCKIPFDFTNVKDLYIELKDGDMTPLHCMVYGCILYYTKRVFIPYTYGINISHYKSYDLYVKLIIQTLDDITPDLSRYIPEDNAVMFLSQEDGNKYSKGLEYQRTFVYEKPSINTPLRNPFIYFTCRPKGDNELPICRDVNNHNLHRNEYKKVTIFLPHGTLSELQKANETAKELKEKYGVEEVNVFVLHCFAPVYYGKTAHVPFYGLNIVCRDKCGEFDIEDTMLLTFINKVITTNSTSILKPQDNEKLQVIDCFDIFNEAL